MKRLILLVLLIGVVFIAYNRERVYVRDPLGTVTRNGAKEHGAQVYINYSNDALIENDNGAMYTTLIQSNRPIGTPDQLKCIHWLVCMTNADSAGLSAVDEHAHIDGMNNKAVHFTDGQGRDTVVTLR